MTKYEEAERYILDIPKFAGKNTLADTEKLLKIIYGDENRHKIIHVAGTNGKGSVCAYLRSILMEGGIRTGMFTSPHLICIRERICVDNEMISEEEFVTLFNRVKQAIEEGKAQGLSHPSFFEFLFLMAMGYFKLKNVEYIILETGLGGRLDATNVIKDPEVCVITSIGYDHMQYLGNTLVEIAGEKAGIMKTGSPVVFFDREKEVTQVLLKYAKKAGSPAVIIKKTEILNVNINNKTIDFSFQSGYYNYISLILTTKAYYQVENAALAVTAAEQLKDQRIGIYQIRSGLQNAFWPGRMEEAEDGVFIDGAHNTEGMAAFLESVRSDGCTGQRSLLFSVVSDKQYEKMIHLIKQAGLFNKIAVAALETDRSVDKGRLMEVFGQYKYMNCFYFDSVKAAYLWLKGEKEGDDLIYIAGSLYLAGQIKSLMKENAG